jgi:hypothetical protein
VNQAKAPATFTKLLQVLIGFNHLRPLHVGLLFIWALAKKQKSSIDTTESQQLQFAENLCILTFNSLSKFLKPLKTFSQTAFYAYLSPESS